jgi:hypothetical protein
LTGRSLPHCRAQGNAPSLLLAHVAVTIVMVRSSATGARATEALPRYDVDQKCLQTGEQMNSARMRNVCVEREQQAYDAMKTAWPKLDPAAQLNCLRIGESMQSYRIVQVCVEREGQPAGNVQTFKP